MSHYFLNDFSVVEMPDPHTQRVWLVDRRGQHTGPFSTIELALAAKNGLLDQNDCIWRSGLPCWFRVAEVDGLLPKAVPAERARPDGDLGIAARFAELPARTGITGHYSAALAFIEGAPRARRDAAQSYSDAVRASHLPVRSSRMFPPTSPAMAAHQTAPSRMAPVSALSKSIERTPQHAARIDQSSVTRRVADSIAHEIVVMLDRNNIRTVEDLTSNDRLHQLAGFTFDALPTAIRFTLSSTVGKPRIEAHILDALVMLRTALLSPAFRSMNLRQVAANQAPAIAMALETAIVQTAAGIGSAVASKWNSVFGSIWGGSSDAPQHGPYAALAPAE